MMSRSALAQLLFPMALLVSCSASDEDLAGKDANADPDTGSDTGHVSDVTSGPDACGEPGISWSPPPSEIVDMQAPNVVTGRLWVLPNPIRVRPEWAGSEMTIAVESIGSSVTIIEGIMVTGSPDFYLPYPDSFDYPLEQGSDREGCHGAGGMGFGLAFSGESGAMEEATLTIHTCDPTSPTVDVPIIYDLTGEQTPDDPFAHMPEIDERHILVRPNPIHIGLLRPGETSTVDICMSAPGGWMEPPGTEVSARVWGEGLDLVSATDSTGTPVPLPVEDYLLAPDGIDMVLAYESVTGEPLDGALITDFINSWGDVMTLVVPILVR